MPAEMAWYEAGTPNTISPTTPTIVKDSEPPKSAKQIGCCMSYRDYAVQYFDESGLHGVKYFGGTSITTICEKILWFLLFFGSFGLFCFTMTPIFQDYLDGATAHVEQIRSEKHIEYPAITICNPNQFRRLIIGNSSSKYFKMSKFPDTPTQKIKQQCAAPYLFDVTDPEYAKGLPMDSIAYMLEGPDSLMGLLGFNANSIWGHDAYQSVVSCKFRGVRLTDEECYGTFINRMTDTGLCFTFNIDKHFRTDSRSVEQKELLGPGSDASNRYPFLKKTMEKTEFKSYMRGSEGSIELLLNVRQFEYCDVGGHSTAGLSVYIHSKDVLPMSLGITENEIKLTPGTETAISLQRIEYERDTEKFGRCTSKINEKLFPHLPMYDQSVCIAECLINLVIRKCNCIPDFSPDTAVDFMLRKKNLLATFHTPAQIFCLTSSDRLCYRKSYRNFTMENRALVSECPNCQLPCRATLFDYSLSYGQFPASNKFNEFKDQKFAQLNYTALKALSVDDKTFQKTIAAMEKLDFRKLKLSNEFKDIGEVRDNLILLRISLETMTTVVKQDKLAMTLPALLSNLGGSIGLYIGASILSFLEIFFWIYVCLCAKCRK